MKVRLVVELTIDDSISPLDVLGAVKSKVDDGYNEGDPVQWIRGWVESANVRRSAGKATVL